MQTAEFPTGLAVEILYGNHIPPRPAVIQRRWGVRCAECGSDRYHVICDDNGFEMICCAPLIRVARPQ